MAPLIGFVRVLCPQRIPVSPKQGRVVFTSLSPSQVTSHMSLSLSVIVGLLQKNPKMSSDRDEKILKELEYATEHAYELQLETLQSILDRTATGASYLAPFFLGQGGPTDPDSFRRLVPISSYDDYVSPILAMADGDDRPILSVDPLICFFYRYLPPLPLINHTPHHPPFFFAGPHLMNARKSKLLPQIFKS